MSDSTSRRAFLNKTLLGAAGASAVCGLEGQLLAAAPDPTASAAPPPATPNAANGLPTGQIGKVTMSRMLMGGNLIGGWAHGRDLIYLPKLFKAYNTEEKIFETLQMAEQAGINTIQIDPVCQPVVDKYRQRGGKIQTMVCLTALGDEAKMREQAKFLVDSGATLMYTHGEFTDRHTMSGQLDVLAKALEAIKAQGVPAGIGSHSLETPTACEKHNLGAEFYVKTFHLDRYWSATPKEHRKEWCWYQGQSPDFTGYHDNMWCLDAEKTAAFFEQVQKPWVAFKVLAAGAIHPQVGFTSAFRAGADFIIVGMFDFQVAQNVELARAAVSKTKERTRPWRA